MTQLLKRLGVLLSCLGLAAALASCGGSGGGSESGDSSGSIQGKGTVGILLTDMPADPALFASINATIEKVELMGSEDNGRVTLYSGGSKTFDLLRLRNEAIPLTFKDDVPAGVYCKIRLTLSDLELVMTEAATDSGHDSTYHPRLPGNGKLDLVVRDCINVLPDEVVTLQLDMDAGKSIHVVENKKGFNFRPVIFIDIVDQTFDSKLVRLTGEITRIDQDGQALLLCDAIPGDDMTNHGCVKIHFGDDSAFFDNYKYSDLTAPLGCGGSAPAFCGGMPRAIDKLLSDENLGKTLTVVGWQKFLDLHRDDDDDWHTDDDGPSEYYPLMQLDALVAELGEFLQLEGEVTVDATASEFTMAVSPGGSITFEQPLKVMLQAGGIDSTGSNFNGTRVISKSGELLNPVGNVIVPSPLQVDGILQLVSGSDAVLQAALVIVEKIAPGAEQVTGKIISFNGSTLNLDPDADSVCGNRTNDLLVTLADELKFLTVTIEDSKAVITPGGTLADGQTIGMNGTCEIGGTYRTDNVVVVDDNT